MITINVSLKMRFLRQLTLRRPRLVALVIAYKSNAVFYLTVT